MYKPPLLCLIAAMVVPLLELDLSKHTYSYGLFQNIIRIKNKSPMHHGGSEQGKCVIKTIVNSNCMYIITLLVRDSLF
jgi:hypothetical protein